jgi:hypothetical protein
MGNRTIWLLVLLILGAVGAACGVRGDVVAMPCDFAGQTAVSLNILNENNQPQRLVNVRYRLDDGPWQTFPESVNERALFQEGPGTYQIRLEKPGYLPAETAVVVPEPGEGSCQLAEQTVALPMALAVCPPDQLTSLTVEIVSDSSEVGVTAVSQPGGAQAVSCTQADAANCHHYELPLNQIGSYTLDVTGLAGLGPMFVENGVVTYTLRPSQITLRQNSLEHSLSLTGANSVSASFSVGRDETGCAQVDFRTLTAVARPDVASSEPFPKLGVNQLSRLLMTDLGAAACAGAPQPYPVQYEAIVPAGVPLADVAMLTYLDGAWQAASCGVEDGRLLCTAVYPNPLIRQPYAYKIVAAGQEYVGTSLPFDNLCLIFD